MFDIRETDNIFIPPELEEISEDDLEFLPTESRAFGPTDPVDDSDWHEAYALEKDEVD